jgi:hypothetical protein
MPNSPVGSRTITQPEETHLERDSLSLPSPEYRLEEVRRKVTEALSDQKLANDPRTILSPAEIVSLEPALLQRALSDKLAPQGIATFASHVTHGGIPISLFLKNPLISLEINDALRVNKGQWLPSYLRESAVVPEKALDIQQQRITATIQETLRQHASGLPVFFIGSAAAVPSRTLPSDIDIATSTSLRAAHRAEYDTIFSSLRTRMAANPLILGNKNHIGAVFSEMTLAIGVSVTRYGRALRVSPDEVFAIERQENFNRNN